MLFRVFPRPSRRWVILWLAAVLILVSVGPVLAHANLERSEPPANAVLPATPGEIRLWFTEPLEPAFSKIILRDQNGSVLEMPPSQVDPNDPFQMVLVPTELPEGVYTVAWRALSQADGHPSLGSFPIVIGNAVSGLMAVTSGGDSIQMDGSLVRFANLISMALGVGGLAFMLFVWQPTMPDPQPRVEQRMSRFIWAGWVLMGITGVLYLLMQHGLATGNPMLVGINGDTLNALVSNTRFGQLWLVRMALWGGMGGALWFARGDRWFIWVALILGGGILFVNSAFSHANAAFDLNVAVATDWLHLVSMVLWIGGLVQFVNIIGPARQIFSPAAPVLSRLVAHFTNFARAAVAILFLTGLYSAWLQVGSAEGLLDTAYGRALLLKLILIAPVIVLAAINMIYTHQGLAAGHEVWTRRLRGLVTAEVALTLAILFTVGMMTSTSPARTTLAQRAANPPPPLPKPIVETQTANDLTMELSIAPGWIGENTFFLKLTSNGEPVNDASLIRMRFESQTENLGESELRPALQGDGVYAITAANLSAIGKWRVRVTVQRPDQFDALADFTPDMPAPPTPVAPVRLPDASDPLPNRTLILIIAGVGALAIGGFFLGENRPRPVRLSTLLAVSMLLLGGLFLATAVQETPTVSAADEEALLAAAPANAVPVAPAPRRDAKIFATSSETVPTLIDTDGQILRADTRGLWSALPLQAAVNDVYVDASKTIWAATDAGLYRMNEGETDWTLVDDLPVIRLDLMHGYLFALGQGQIVRVPAGGTTLEGPRRLDTPLADEPNVELVMLGDHSHIILNGTRLFLTEDLGLSWKPVPGPNTEAVQMIAVDRNGNLLATTRDALYTWAYKGKAWGPAVSLPESDSKPILRVLSNELYAVAGGRLVRFLGLKWLPVRLPEGDDAYIAGMAFQYPQTLWVVDSGTRTMWFSSDGLNWTKQGVEKAAEAVS